ncbi:hypothetical protein RB195_019265 [Necator americanus]|uniref:Reverse transcriptase domain-containing protein n=1 Tax=Necator americanus TaxID=51031 RepID=A0ABR1CDD6_NECAM
MLRRPDRLLLQDSEVIPADHVTAQHHLLVMDLKISRPRKRHLRTETQRFKWWNLRDRKERHMLGCGEHSAKYDSRRQFVKRIPNISSGGGHVSLKIKSERVIAQRWIWSTPRSLRELMEPFCVALVRSWRGDESTTITCVTKSSAILPTVPSVEGPVLRITAVEVSADLAKMKSNKPTGPDDIPTDVWKLLGDRGSMWLTTLFNKIVAEGRTPDVWQTSVTMPIWKGKREIADCTSYRPIRLLCYTMMVFERVLEARLRKIVSVSLNQCGFATLIKKIEHVLMRHGRKWKMAAVDKKVPVRLKSKIYRMVVRLVALNGCECRPTTKALGRVLHDMEMRMLRGTIGVTLKDQVFNDTIRSIFDVVPITEKMKEARLRWLEAAWMTKDSLVGPCEAGYNRCALVYG